jgi:hypothetical protein
MEHKDISAQVQEAWSQIDQGFPGQRIKGTWLVDCLKPLTNVPELSSSIYTQLLEERCCAPRMPEPYDACFLHPVPDGIAFKAQVATRQDNPEQFLAAMFEGTGKSHEFKAYFLTNDPVYAVTHQKIKWEYQG